MKGGRKSDEGWGCNPAWQLSTGQQVRGAADRMACFGCEGGQGLAARGAYPGCAFTEPEGSVFWGRCGLRSWIKEEFIPRAFSPEEKERIYQPEKLEYTEDDVILWKVFEVEYSAEYACDLVFLLSSSDIEQYFPSEDGDSLFCPGASAQPSDWVFEQHGSDDLCWWLSSSSAHSGIVNVVSPADSIGASWNVDENVQGVRPALWLRMDQ